MTFFLPPCLLHNSLEACNKVQDATLAMVTGQKTWPVCSRSSSQGLIRMLQTELETGGVSNNGQCMWQMWHIWIKQILNFHWHNYLLSCLPHIYQSPVMFEMQNQGYLWWLQSSLVPWQISVLICSLVKTDLELTLRVLATLTTVPKDNHCLPSGHSTSGTKAKNGRWAWQIGHWHQPSSGGGDRCDRSHPCCKSSPWLPTMKWSLHIKTSLICLPTVTDLGFLHIYEALAEIMGKVLVDIKNQRKLQGQGYCCTVMSA